MEINERTFNLLLCLHNKQVTPNKFDFVRDSINVIDFIATLSFYSDMLLQKFASDLENAGIYINSWLLGIRKYTYITLLYLSLKISWTSSPSSEF